jgi:hypothetical protein
MRLGPCAALVAIVLGIAACTSPPRPRTASTPPPVSAFSPAPESPSPTSSTAQVTAWVDAATLSPLTVGAPQPVQESHGPADVFVDCNKKIAADATVVYAHHWIWVGNKVPFVDHAVFAYPGPAAQVVKQIKARATSCKSYDRNELGAGKTTVQFVGAYAFQPLAGIDSEYAFCEKDTTVPPASQQGQVANVSYFCTAAFSRGNVLATVRVSGEQPTVASAHAALAPVLPLCEKALIGAVPAR